MSDDKSNPQTKQQPKKNLNIDEWLKPVTQVETSIGELYLFPLTVPDITKYKDISSPDAISRIRAFLPCISNLSPDNTFQHEKVPITDELVKQLCNEEIEKIAKSYAANEKDLKNIKHNERNEPATSFLDRLLKNMSERQHNNFHNYSNLSGLINTTSRIFDEVYKKSHNLENTIENYRKLSRESEIHRINNEQRNIINTLDEHQKRINQERAEDRKMVRLTGEMTLQSAELLKELVDSATIAIDKMDERDTSNKKSTDKQIRIAIGGIFFSVLLSFHSCLQDFSNDNSSNKWQKSVLSELKRNNESEDKIKILNDEVLKMKHKIITLEEQLRSVKDKKTVSTTTNSKP